MSLPQRIRLQLESVLNKDTAADRIALVWQEPFTQPVTDIVKETTVKVVYCPSQLAIREQLTDDHDNARLVLLSPFERTELAQDIIARLWNHQTLRLDSRRLLQEQLGVQSIDPRLLAQAWIIQALLQYYDRYAGKISFGQVLDEDSAWQALSCAFLDFDQPLADMQSVLEWSLRTDVDVEERIRQAPAEFQQQLTGWLKPGSGQLADVLQMLLVQGHGNTLVAAGLAAAVLFELPRPAAGERAAARHEALLKARIRFNERLLGGADFSDEQLRDFGRQTEALAGRLLKQDQRQRLQAQFDNTERLLHSLDIAHLAEHSDLLPLGFEQRLEQVAQTLTQQLKKPQPAELETAIEHLQKHYLVSAGTTSIRFQRMQMAVRLARWLAGRSATVPASARQSALNYATDGGFVDRARSHIWQGDQNATVDKIYRRILQAVTAHCEQANRQFGTQLAAIARGDNAQPDALPIESALTEIVTPLATRQPILLLVVDGMSMAVYRELAEDLSDHGWMALQEQQLTGERCLLAALPTATRFSRCSLLSGQRQSGTSVQEKKAFTGFPALKKLSGAKSPPQLYHQGELRERGGGGLAGDVRKTLSTTEHKIIGVVLNAVDDHLSSGSQVVSRWNIAQIAHLEQILDAAREAGRIVILTSDHGHVLEHDTEYRGSLSSPERYKTATDGTDEFEINVSGPRVLTEDHVAILPWSEKVRYTRSRGYGYHGGGTLQEVVVPLGMFISDAKVPAGWNTTSLYYPDWWQAAPAPAVALTMTEPVTGKPTGKRKKAGDDATIDLFATAPEPQPSAASSWVDALLLSPVYQSQKNRNLRFKIQDEQLQQLLQMLLKSGGQLPQIALATALKLPPMRISGFLAGVQKLLNVDGYPVLSVDRNTQMVKLDRELLKKQFELTE